LLVSLADKVDNAEAILSDYQQIGDKLWDRFNGRATGYDLVLSRAEQNLSATAALSIRRWFVTHRAGFPEH